MSKCKFCKDIKEKTPYDDWGNEITDFNKGMILEERN